MFLQKNCVRRQVVLSRTLLADSSALSSRAAMARVRLVLTSTDFLGTAVVQRCWWGLCEDFWFSCNSSGRFSQNWLVSALRRKLVAQSWFTPQFLGRCPYHRFFKPSSLKYIQELSLASKEYLELKHMLTRVICSDQWKRRPFHTTIFSQVHANPRGVNSQLSKASEIQTKMAGLQLNKSSLFSKKKVSTSEVEGWKPGRATTWFQTSGLTHNFRYQTRFCFKN